MIRVWWEEDPDGKALRARITRTLDVSDADRVETAVASEEEEIVAAVSAWLRSFTAPTR